MKSVNRLDKQKSYICGMFQETMYFIGAANSSIHLLIESIETEKYYSIAFDSSAKLKLYEIPPGHYKLKSFLIECIQVSQIVTNFNRLQTPKYIETERVINSNCSIEFQIGKGEIFYIGSYLGKRAISKYSRSSYCQDKNNFEEVQRILVESKRNIFQDFDVFNLYDYIECKNFLEQIDCHQNKNQKSYITGSFYNNLSSPDRIQISFINICSKKIYTHSFSGKNFIKLEVEPGEYCVFNFTYIDKDVPSIFFNEQTYYIEPLIPNALLTTFSLHPDTAIYIGDIIITEEKTVFSGNIELNYIYNWPEAQKKLVQFFDKDAHINVTGLNKNELNYYENLYYTLPIYN